MKKIKIKTKLKRKNLVGLVSIILLLLIICSNTSLAGDPEYLGMTYNKFVTPVDNLNIVVSMRWDTLAQRVDGNIYVYYTVNALFPIDITKASKQSFTPSDSDAEQFYLSLQLAGLQDEDNIRFRVWFKWRGYVGGRTGEILSELGKSSYETGDIPTTDFEENIKYLYYGLGVVAIIFVLYVARKILKRKK